MSAKERDAFLLQPLRKIRDYGKPVDASFLEDAPEPVKTKAQLDAESQLVREAEAIAARGAAMAALGGATEEVLEVPTAATGVDIDFSTAEKRGLVVKLSRIEKFFVNTDINIIAYLFNFVTGQSLGSLTTSSKNLYMKVKTSRFTLYMSLRGLSKFSSNIRRGIGYGIVDGCRLHIGITDERCNAATVNSITSYFTAPPVITMKSSGGGTGGSSGGSSISGPIIENFTIQMDESVNDLAMHALISSWSHKSVSHLTYLSVEGCGLQTKGISVLCDVLRKGTCKSIQTLNISRNKCLYLGVHKLAKLIMDQILPNLHTVHVSQNDAGHGLLDFFERKFAEATPFLKHFHAHSNLFDIYDPDVVAQRLRGSGKLSWDNFITIDMSRNILSDSEFARMLKNQVWCMEDLARYKPESNENQDGRKDTETSSTDGSAFALTVTAIKQESGPFVQPSKLQSLYLQEAEVGNHTIKVLSDLAIAGYFPNLELLDVGANAMDSQGVDYLLEPLRRQKLPQLKYLYIQLNKVYSPGILLISSAQSLGVFDNIIDLDLSDIGTSVENITLFAKAIVSRFQIGKCSLQKLKVYGVHPFAGKAVRVMFPPEFLTRVRVS